MTKITGILKSRDYIPTILNGKGGLAIYRMKDRRESDPESQIEQTALEIMKRSRRLEKPLDLEYCREIARRGGYAPKARKTDN